MQIMYILFGYRKKAKPKVIENENFPIFIPIFIGYLEHITFI